MDDVIGVAHSSSDEDPCMVYLPICFYRNFNQKKNMIFSWKKKVGFWEAVTLPETKTANEINETRPSQKDTGIPTIHFQVRKC